MTIWKMEKWPASRVMAEELTTEELSDLRVILVRFMADKEAHKKVPCLESRAPMLWSKLDRMYSINRKRTKTGVEHILLFSKDDRSHCEQ